MYKERCRSRCTWHGQQKETLEAKIILKYEYPLVTVKRNVRHGPKFIHDYSCPKRAMNVICEIMKFAVFEW